MKYVLLLLLLFPFVFAHETDVADDNVILLDHDLLIVTIQTENNNVPYLNIGYVVEEKEGELEPVLRGSRAAYMLVLEEEDSFDITLHIHNPFVPRLPSAGHSFIGEQTASFSFEHDGTGWVQSTQNAFIEDGVVQAQIVPPQPITYASQEHEKSVSQTTDWRRDWLFVIYGIITGVGFVLLLLWSKKR